MHKFAINLVSLFKYLKSCSLFCNDCHSVHFCSMLQWQGQWVMTLASTYCRLSSSVYSRMAIFGRTIANFEG